MSSASEPVGSNPLPQPDPAQLRLLVVDDEPMLRSVIEEFLGLLDYQTFRMACDGREALEMLRAEPCDCMLSDVRMPEMDLEELLGYVSKEFPDLTVIATSGYSDLEHAVEIMGRGAHDFLGKPLNLDALESTLQWIAWRLPILGLAADRFGADAPQPTADQADEHLDFLCRAMDLQDSLFRTRLSHCVRVCKLSRRLELPLALEERVNLALAALLHDLGSSFIMQSLCRQSRRLEIKELELVRAHGEISGRIVAHRLKRNDLRQVIGRHYQWESIDARRAEGPDLLAIWLGLLNFLDGCLSDRSDRRAFSLGRVRESLERRRAMVVGPLVTALLDQWPVLEALYPQ